MANNKVNTYVELSVLVLAISATFFLLWNSGLFVYGKPATFQGKLIIWFGLILAMFTPIAFHELGHLVVGLLQGFKFQLFAVGPLGIKNEDNKIKLYLNKNLAYYGGVAATTPAYNHPNNAEKFGRIAIAGPIASLVYAVLCLGIAYVLANEYSVLFYTAGIISISVFYSTTIPSQSGMFLSDRKRYQRLTTPGKGQEVEMAMMRIMGQYAEDHSYKNIDKKDIEKLIDDKWPFIQFYGVFNMLCYQYERYRKTEKQTEEKYIELSGYLPKQYVLGMNKELEKVRNIYI